VEKKYGKKIAIGTGVSLDVALSILWVTLAVFLQGSEKREVQEEPAASTDWRPGDANVLL
jgi:hypothetical protein